MKTYSTRKVANLQAGILSKKTGIKHVVGGSGEEFIIGTEEEVFKATLHTTPVPPVKVKAARVSKTRKEEKTVEVVLPYFGQDEKYVKVEVGGTKIRMAQSRVIIVGINGDQVTLKMTPTYAAHRELKVA